VEPTFLPEETTPENIFVWYMLFKGMLWFLSPVLLLTLVIQIFKQWFTQEQQHQETAREKLNAELNFLKAQVHPHFLFNTLNNLYSLTLQASPAAPLTVLKLSELMSYMLYDSQSAMVSLSKEINHIRNYVELETIRYGNRLDVSVNVSGEIVGKQIAPLLLIPFAENAFKHGISNETDNVWVTIDIKEKAGWLNVKVENSRTDDGITTTDKGPSGGIGLQNVLRRLDLLYPGSHQLELKKEPDRYMVDLKIKIA
jgi:LytS/YehU family sensor histidine kinase